jgi:hypothetical protein
MSLINEALKKAQKQRESGASATTPPVTPPPPAPPAPPSTPAPEPPRGPKGNSQMVVFAIAGAVVIVALSVVGTVYLLRSNTPPPTVVAVVAPTPSPSVQASAAQTPVTAGVSGPIAPSTAPSPTAPPPTVSLRNLDARSAAAGAVPTPVASTDAPKATAAPAPTATPAPTQAPVVSSETPAIKPTFRVQGMIDKFRVSSIRLAGTDSKVILNDRLFRINDLVEPSLGLRLTKIEAHLLTFTDAEGNEYIKRF